MSFHTHRRPETAVQDWDSLRTGYRDRGVPGLWHLRLPHARPQLHSPDRPVMRSAM
jgi:hypothetical protein